MSDNEQTADRLLDTRGGWRQALLVRLLGRLRVGRLTVTLPDGSRHRFEGEAPGPHAEMRVRSLAVVSRVLRGGAIAFGESYMAGDWDTPHLGDLLYLLHLNDAYLVPQVPGMYRVVDAARSVQHWLRRNSRRGSRRNIRYHYDIGNDFYGLWLDETWSYSSAIFEDDAQGLPEAQRHKYQLLIDRLALDASHHVLEIGCGWGGFAIQAACATGCRVTGITLSAEQLAVARERAERAGVADLVTFRLQDYREVDETFDRVVSVEMYEAVGETYWPTFFAKVRDCLTPTGVAAIQGITIDHGAFPRYRKQVDFIQRYIFPGGMLASPEVFQNRARRQGLASQAPAFYGRHYARTLREWHDRVLASRQAVLARFDESFLRMWRYYLAYCEAGFRSGNIDLMQITLKRA